MLSAAMKGELGPLAQAVAKYQVERRIHDEMVKLKAMEQKLRDIRARSKDPPIPKDQIQVSVLSGVSGNRVLRPERNGRIFTRRRRAFPRSIRESRRNAERIGP